MRSRRSGLYRRRDGEERLWYSPEDIEFMMEDTLRKLGYFQLRSSLPWTLSDSSSGSMFA